MREREIVGNFTETGSHRAGVSRHGQGFIFSKPSSLPIFGAPFPNFCKPAPIFPATFPIFPVAFPIFPRVFPIFWTVFPNFAATFPIFSAAKNIYNCLSHSHLCRICTKSGSAPAPDAVRRASRRTFRAVRNRTNGWASIARGVRCEGAPNHSRGGCAPRFPCANFAACARPVFHLKTQH